MNDCLNLLYQAWFLGDGVLTGTKSSLLRALTIIEDMGPSLCIFINLSKCVGFCGYVPRLNESLSLSQPDIFGIPIGDTAPNSLPPSGLRP